MEIESKIWKKKFDLTGNQEVGKRIRAKIQFKLKKNK